MPPPAHDSRGPRGPVAGAATWDVAPVPHSSTESGHASQGSFATNSKFCPSGFLPGAGPTIHCPASLRGSSCTVSRDSFQKDSEPAADGPPFQRLTGVVRGGDGEGDAGTGDSGLETGLPAP